MLGGFIFPIEEEFFVYPQYSENFQNILNTSSVFFCLPFFFFLKIIK